jgi:hypothetical protein
MKWVVTPVDHSTSHPSSAALRKRCTGGSRSRSKKKGGRASGGPSSPRLDFRGAPSASGQRSSLRFCATWRPRGGTLRRELAELLWPNVSSLLCTFHRSLL